MKKEIVYTDIQLDEGYWDDLKSKVGGLFGGAKSQKEPAETVGDALKANLASTTPAAPAGPSIDPNSAVPLFTGKDSLYQRLMNSVKSRIKQFNLNPSDTQTVVTQFDTQIKQVLKDIATQMKTSGLTNKQIQEALATPAPAGAPAAAPTASPAAAAAPAKTGQGGRVQAKSGIIDVRRAVFGKFEQAMKSSNLDAAMDDNTRKALTADMIEKIIIPFISQHLSARGFNVTDKKAGRSIPAKNATGTPKNVTLSESTVNRWKVLAEIKK